MRGEREESVTVTVGGFGMEGGLSGDFEQVGVIAPNHFEHFGFAGGVDRRTRGFGEGESG